MTKNELGTRNLGREQHSNTSGLNRLDAFKAYNKSLMLQLAPTLDEAES